MALHPTGVPVIGPIGHGMCQSVYFAGPEGLALEIATGSGIDSPGPHLAYPPAVYARVLATPDEAMWSSVESRPPVAD